MMRNLILILLLSGASLIAYGQQTTVKDIDLKTCEKTTNVRKRAICFETLAKQQSQEQDAKREQEKKSKELVKKLQEHAVAEFKDPVSAQFRNVILRQGTSKSRITYSLCGEVNAKNSYGGYVGFRRFYVSFDAESNELFKTIEGKKSVEFPQIDTTLDELFTYHWGMHCVDSWRYVVLWQGMN